LLEQRFVGNLALITWLEEEEACRDDDEEEDELFEEECFDLSFSLGDVLFLPLDSFPTPIFKVTFDDELEAGVLFGKATMSML